MSIVENLLVGVTEKSPFAINMDSLVLSILLSECIEMKGIYYSNITEDLIVEEFKLPIREYKKSIDNLRTKGYIQKHKDGSISVASYDVKKGEITYFCDQKEGDLENELESERLEVSELFKNYVTTCNKRGKAIQQDQIKEVLATVLRGNFSNANHLTFGRYFSALQEVVFQRVPRKLSGKEYAQLKTLVNMYEAVVLVKLMTYYVVNSFDFHDNTPSIGYLLGFKDKIYGKLFNAKLNSKDKFRHEEKQVGFA